MKTSKKLIYATAAVALTGLIIYAIRKKNTKNRVAQVADEGYETAADVLHPTKNSRFKKLHYGPVLPHHSF
ncbi:hypothetical protein ACFOWM_11475 [Ferruginibacter yonginensis]|uniref:Uncharacterized protein n=1 Tax=Ferruginibacter yonginensis TaxID=1310416 RepID=A0ABV8QX09_9BACT